MSKYRKKIVAGNWKMNKSISMLRFGGRNKAGIKQLSGS